MTDYGLGVAPWTESQVRNLKRWQMATWVHPYTCGPCRDADTFPLRDEHLLVPTVEGWTCPTCGFFQNWCQAEMLNGPPPDPMARR